LKRPSLLFPSELIFDDGNHRVELRYFGVAHTHGDGFAWLPKEKVLFTGDACVNGPYNYCGDGDTGQWVRTLEAARRLDARVVCPGHGPLGNGSLLDDQQTYFVELRRQVARLKDEEKSPGQIMQALDGVKATLQKNQHIARYVGDFFPAQVEKV